MLNNESVNTKLDYLLSTGLYEKGTKQHPYTHMYHEQEMLNTDKTISIKELTMRGKFMNISLIAYKYKSYIFYSLNEESFYIDEDTKEQIIKGFAGLKVRFENILDDTVFTPAICVINTKSEPEYDYDWEENLEFTGNMVQTETIVPIKYNPFTGEKIEFSITKTIDLTKDLEKILTGLENYNKLKKPKISDTKKYYQMLKNLDELTKNCALVIRKEETITSNTVGHDVYLDGDEETISQILNNKDFPEEEKDIEEAIEL